MSGQLHLEVITAAFAKAYNFSPVFRAENSRGRHQLSEFTMVEAEVSFIYDVINLSSIVEGLLKSCTEEVLSARVDELQWFNKHVASEDHAQIVEKLITKDFIRMTYSEAVDILAKSGTNFVTEVVWGMDFQKEHESI